MNLDKKYTDYAIEQIVKLCQMPSPSGFTQSIIQTLFEEFDALGHKGSFSNKGSLLVEMGGQGKGLILAAHVDTLGAMIRSIKSNGRLRLTKIGGYPENTIEGENCLVHTRQGANFSGTIQLLHPSVHVYEDVATMQRNESNIEVILDEKVVKESEVLELGIQVGDFISFDARTRYTPSGFIKIGRAHV